MHFLLKRKPSYGTIEIPPLLIHSSWGGFCNPLGLGANRLEVLGGHKPKESTTSKALLADTFRYREVLATL